MSQRGKPLLVHDGHTFGIQYVRKDKKYWQCNLSRKFNCKARVTTTDTGDIIVTNNEHCHTEIRQHLKKDYKNRTLNHLNRSHHRSISTNNNNHSTNSNTTSNIGIISSDNNNNNGNTSVNNSTGNINCNNDINTDNNKNNTNNNSDNGNSNTPPTDMTSNWNFKKEVV